MRTRHVSVAIDGELHKALKVRALDEDTTLRDLIVALLKDAVKEDQ